ncbi:helix-turn-helix domain-containing protein [Opitutales bacterium]|nr:helix-turn-helix domain-containing protein [Opitutales bacterium]
MISFAKIFTYLVRGSSLNLSQISREAGISRPSLYDLLNGRNLPKETTLERLISVLKLTQKDEEELKKSRDLERIKTNRIYQQSLLKEQKHLIREVGAILLSNGLEVSKPNQLGSADLIIRNGHERTPIKIYSKVLDYPSALGTILSVMHDLNAKKSYLCTPLIQSETRKNLSLFGKYGIKILTIKGLLRDLT